VPHVQLSGGCHCGNLRLLLQLTREPAEYSPRACDCDFCRKHGAAWLSDAQGSLRITVREPAGLGKYTQGSRTAELLLCQHCGVLVAACLNADGRLYGAVNARAVEGDAPFAATQVVSPQQLSVDDKARRWRQLWFSDVSIIAAEAAGSGGVGATRA